MTNQLDIIRQTEHKLTHPRALEEFAKALNRQIDPDQFVRILVSTYRLASDYAKKCSPQSWLIAAYECAQRGLRPDAASAEFYFVPRYSKNTKQVEIAGMAGYQGLIQLAYRGGAGRIVARCVYEGDEFDAVYTENGEAIIHRPARQMGRDKGAIRLAYAVAKLANGEKIYMPVDHERIETAMKMSGDPRKDEPSEVWINHPAKMWMKTAVRDLWPMLPRDKVASAVAGYIAEDFAREDGEVARPTVSAAWMNAIDPEAPPNSLGELTAAPGLERETGNPAE